MSAKYSSHNFAKVYLVSLRAMPVAEFESTKCFNITLQHEEQQVTPKLLFELPQLVLQVFL